MAAELLPSSIRVDVTNLQAMLPVDAEWVGAIVTRLLKTAGIAAAEISVVVVDDAAIRGINARHLAHDWPTDVVSFAFGSIGDPDFGGELIISAEMAIREAGLRRIAPRDEFALYVVHGLLHICGFDDLSEADARTMRVREGDWLGALGIENPFGRGHVGSGMSE